MKTKKRRYNKKYEQDDYPTDEIPIRFIPRVMYNKGRKEREAEIIEIINTQLDINNSIRKEAEKEGDDETKNTSISIEYLLEHILWKITHKNKSGTELSLIGEQRMNKTGQTGSCENFKKEQIKEEKQE